MFLSALPHRLSAIAVGAQAGDAAGVAAAADALAVAAQRFGHAEVAFLSSARRPGGTPRPVTHGRLVALVELCARIDAGSALRSDAGSRPRWNGTRPAPRCEAWEVLFQAATSR